MDELAQALGYSSWSVLETYLKNNRKLRRDIQIVIGRGKTQEVYKAKPLRAGPPPAR